MDERDHSDAKSAEEDPASETVSNPSELIRLSAMTARLLEEVRDTSLDDAGCRSLVRIHGRAMEMIESTLSGGLRAELTSLAPPMDEDRTSEAELRVAQAQLVGWLDGLVLSLQAALVERAAAPAPAAAGSPVPGGHAYL
jgi:hypothetical protein